MRRRAPTILALATALGCGSARPAPLEPTSATTREASASPPAETAEAVPAEMPRGARTRAVTAPAITLSESPDGGAVLHAYFGNLHSHTSYSDGSGTPEDAFTMARESGLHFLAVTEHNHRGAELGAEDRADGRLIATDHELYRGASHSLVETAHRMTVPGTFAAIYGQEWSSISSGNHVNVFAIDDVIDDTQVRNGDFSALLTWLHARESGQPTLIQFNHPALHDGARAYGRDDFHSVEAWVAALDPHVELIEVLNGPAMAREGGHEPAEMMHADYLEYLNIGFHLGPTADQDNHYHTWGTATDARTGVLAAELTPSAVLAALRARRVFATEASDLAGVLWAAGVLMGGEIPCGTQGQIPIHVRTIDATDADVSYRVEVFVDGATGGNVARVVEQADLGTTPQAELVASIERPAAGGYVFARITQMGEHTDARVWTAPVWFARCGDAPSSLPAVQIVAVLPDPEGSDEENERVRLRNTSSGRIDLRGWRLRDRAGSTWTLSGRVQPGAELVVMRRGQPMALNNSGGELVELLDAGGEVVDSLSYDGAAAGAWVER